MDFQKVLVAVDEDPIAAHAAEVGMALARSLHAEVALIHATDPSAIYAPEPGMADDELALALSAERDGARVMADFRARLPAGSEVLQFIPHGRPGPEIVKAAQEWGADLIVIGSHGRRGLTRTLMGSVAEAVMHHAPCPVLVVRAKA
jgi:nucleotide-binding universal stress UspA family protein